jgi:tetratricopeptide (TPR) repeat protein
MKKKTRFFTILVLTAAVCFFMPACAMFIPMIIHRTGSDAINDDSRKGAYDAFMKSCSVIFFFNDQNDTASSVYLADPKVNNDGFEFKESPNTKGNETEFFLKFTDLGDPEVVDWHSWGGSLGGQVYVELQNSGNTARFYLWLDGRGRCASREAAINAATLFADSLYVLIHDPPARTYSAAKEAFKKMAEIYRSNPREYELTEEARKYFVRAEEAFKDNKYNEAVELYNKGLKEAPWYPRGHYKLAVILGEQLADYNGAIDVMKKYLALSPGSAHARAAQDMVYEWEGKTEKYNGSEKQVELSQDKGWQMKY